MSHSVYGYLQRRTTEELENALTSYLSGATSEFNREVIRMTLQVLNERNVCLSAEYQQQISDYFENSCRAPWHFCPLGQKLRCPCGQARMERVSTGHSQLDYSSPAANTRKASPKGLAFLVPLTGLEPVQYRYRGILSPLCLPIPPQRRLVTMIPYFYFTVKIVLEKTGIIVLQR